MFGILAFVIGAAIWHVQASPYPTMWDDGMYATDTFLWMERIEARGLLRGVFWGTIYELPPYYLPMVYFTSLAGGLLGKTMVAMRMAHLAWYVVMLLAVYGTAARLRGPWTGVLAVVIVVCIAPLFFWGKTIMSEPALYAALALFFFMLIRWGDRLTPWRGALIGLVLAVGMLSKEYFPFLIVGPLGLWALWAWKNQRHDELRWRRTIYSIAAGFVVFVLIAGPVWVKYWPGTLERLRWASAGSLGPGPTLSIVTQYLRYLLSDLGWPMALLALMGIMWSGRGLITAKNPPLWRGDWQAFAPLLLLSSGLLWAIILLIGSYNRSYTRFFYANLVPWGILGALAFASLWRRGNRGGRALLLFWLTLVVVFWWSWSFGRELPRSLTFGYQQSYMRPQSIDPLPAALTALEDQLSPETQASIAVVGLSGTFNAPLVDAIIKERGLQWQADALYEWDETNLTELYARISASDYALIQEPGSVTDASTKYDREIIAWIQAQPARFEQVVALRPSSGRPAIWIYRIHHFSSS